MRRFPTTIFAIMMATATVAISPIAHADDADNRPVTSQPRSLLSEDLYMLQDSARQGLHAPVSALRDRINLPYGLSYHRDSKSLLLQPDDRSDWGVGINLNLNATPMPELAPSGISLIPKRTPGLTFQKKF